MIGDGTEEQAVADKEDSLTPQPAGSNPVNPRTDAEDLQGSVNDQPEDTGEPGPGQEPEQVRPATPAPPSLVRRLLRNRTARATAAGVLAGALLGAGTVAWQTDTLPLLTPAPCWDSLSDKTVSALFGDRRTQVEEQRLQADPRGNGLSYGQCRITSYKDDRARRQLTVKVHKLDGLRGSDARQWPEEFLAAGMTSLGQGLPGMVSPSRAWLAVPQSCTGRPGSFEGPVVVDAAMGPAGFDTAAEYAQEDRTALARAVVEATNGVIRELGCSGTYRGPDLPADVATWQDTQAEAFCGIKGLTLPTEYRADLARTRTSGPGTPARICEVGGTYPKARLRLTTVMDPALADVFSQDVLKGGTPFKGANGYGAFNVTRAVYRARCQTGDVIFMAERKDNLDKGGDGVLRALVPAYIEAEAERIGCAPDKVTLPGP